MVPRVSEYEALGVNHVTSANSSQLYLGDKEVSKSEKADQRSSKESQ